MLFNPSWSLLQYFKFKKHWRDKNWQSLRRLYNKQPSIGRGDHIYNKHAANQPNYKGRISGLKCHVYDCDDASQVDQYTNATKENSY